MQNQGEYCLVISTCPDEGVAKSIASGIIDAHLAACINILPKVVSVYEWQGKKEQSDETMLLIKANREQYAALQAFIVSKHPYELPEVIAVPICDGLPDYLAWLSGTLRK